MQKRDINISKIAHSIVPLFVSKFLTENKIKIKKLISACGFNNYLGINEEYVGEMVNAGDGILM